MHYASKASLAVRSGIIPGATGTLTGRKDLDGRHTTSKEDHDRKRREDTGHHRERPGVFVQGHDQLPRLADAKSLVAMMQRATGAKAVMWGDAIVGCDTYTIRYADGREAPWPRGVFAAQVGVRPLHGLEETSRPA